MENVKKLLALLLTLHCVVAIIMPTNALEAQPLADGTNTAEATLAISPVGQASCGVTVKAKDLTYRIEATMSLYQIDDSYPDPLKSWTVSGVANISVTKSYYVTKGHDYQVMATITIKDSSGKQIESFDTPSSIIHY